MTLSLFSIAFQSGGRIPTKYTYNEQNISPPPTWNEGPVATHSFALIMDGHDAPGTVFTH